jgi:serine/threonine-protein phosphatase 5
MCGRVSPYTFRRALELDPQNQAVLSNRAFAYIRSEEYGSAIADASAAIAMDPKQPKVSRATVAAGYVQPGDT